MISKGMLYFFYIYNFFANFSFLKVGEPCILLVKKNPNCNLFYVIHFLTAYLILFI